MKSRIQWPHTSEIRRLNLHLPDASETLLTYLLTYSLTFRNKNVNDNEIVNGNSADLKRAVIGRRGRRLPLI